jgi:hypothetical protein
MPAHPRDIVHITSARDQVGLIGIKRFGIPVPTIAAGWALIAASWMGD